MKIVEAKKMKKMKIISWWLKRESRECEIWV